MNNEKKEDKLRAFARYSISYEQLGDVRNASHQLTVDDLDAVTEKVISEDITVDRFFDEWVEPMTKEPELVRAYDTGKYLNGSCDSRNGLLLNDDNVISYILQQFSELITVYISELKGIEIPAIREAREVIRLHRENQGSHFEQWKSSYMVKKNFVRNVEHRINDKEPVSNEEKTLFKDYIESLIASGSKTGLRIKGQMSYGGNELYPCDWEVSRSCLSTLFERTGNAGYAYSLGCLYYYGHGPENRPQYEQAFPYFVYGYANNDYESAFKLAEMYRKGKGTFQSEETACSIIERLYPRIYEEYCQGEGKLFAQAALQMGRVMEEHYQDNWSAYSYYLQARYALLQSRRWREGIDPGLLQITEKALERTEDSVDLLRGNRFVSDGLYFYDLVNENDYIAEAEVRKYRKGHLITLKRLLRKSENTVDRMLVVLPEYGHVEMCDEIRLYVPQGYEVTEGTFRFDNSTRLWDPEEEKGTVVLTLGGESVAELPEHTEYKIR